MNFELQDTGSLQVIRLLKDDEYVGLFTYKELGDGWREITELALEPGHRTQADWHDAIGVCIEQIVPDIVDFEFTEGYERIYSESGRFTTSKLASFGSVRALARTIYDHLGPIREAKGLPPLNPLRRDDPHQTPKLVGAR